MTGFGDLNLEIHFIWLFYIQDKYHAQLSLVEHDNSFITSGQV